MARLAWFTPLRPDRSGIAAYNDALLPLLSTDHEIDVFTATRSPLAPAGRALRVLPADDFLPRHLRAPYPLVVYQLGNAPCHDFIWPHLVRYPGLLVLHDGQLHHVRAMRLLTRGLHDAYRAEFEYNHPLAPSAASEFFIHAFADSFYYLYPMVRLAVRCARLVAVHSPGLARDLAAEHEPLEVWPIRHGMADPLSDTASRRAAALRARYGVPPGALLFAAFGLLTPEKRIPAVLRAFASMAPEGMGTGEPPHLLLAGGTVDHYDPAAEARELGVADRVHITGYVPDQDLDAHVVMADVCLSLRFPTGGETSGPWLRALAAGKPTIVSNLAHTADTPSLRPGTWEVLPAPLARRGTGSDPLSIAVDVLDEHEELTLAMSRLTADAALREALGQAARAHWTRQHTMAAAVEDYGLVIERALRCPMRRLTDLPAHLAQDPLELGRRLAAEWGVAVDILEAARRGASDGDGGEAASQTGEA